MSVAYTVPTEASSWEPTNLMLRLYLPGNISKNCTRDGWSEMFPDFIDACGYHDAEDESKVRAPRGSRSFWPLFCKCARSSAHLLPDKSRVHVLPPLSAATSQQPAWAKPRVGSAPGPWRHLTTVMGLEAGGPEHWLV